MIFAEPLIRYVVSPGLDESGMILAINMTRVIAINPFLFSIATVLTSIQQAVGRFVFYAFAPAIYNIGIIIGITWFTGGINLFGVQIFEGGIMGVALGVILGAVMQLIVSLIGLFGLGFDYNFKINWKNQGFRTILKLLPARSLDQGIDYVNAIVNTNLSSRMGAGAVRSSAVFRQQPRRLVSGPVVLLGHLRVLGPGVEGRHDDRRRRRSDRPAGARRHGADAGDGDAPGRAPGSGRLEVLRRRHGQRRGVDH
jgi:putative peptidoglycan lipid II flippase